MTTVTLLAPGAAASKTFQASSGNKYTSTAAGLLLLVAQGDVLDLVNAGCALFAANGAFKMNIPLMHGRTDTGLVLDATGGAGLFKITNVTGTSAKLAGENALSNTKTDKVLFEVRLDQNYVAGANISVAVNQKIAGGGTPSTKTLTLTAYKIADDGTYGANLGPAAQNMATVQADLTFVVTGATLSPGDRIVLELTSVLTETAASNIDAEIYSVRLS